MSTHPDETTGAAYDEKMAAVEAAVGKAMLSWSRLEIMLKLQTIAVLGAAGHTVTEVLELMSNDGPHALIRQQKKVRSRLDFDGDELAVVREWWRLVKATNMERNEFVHGHYALRSDAGEWLPIRGTFRVTQQGQLERSLHMLSPDYLGSFGDSVSKCWAAWHALPERMQVVANPWHDSDPLTVI